MSKGVKGCQRCQVSNGDRVSIGVRVSLVSRDARGVKGVKMVSKDVKVLSGDKGWQEV